MHLEVHLPDGSTTSSTMSFVYPHLNGTIDSTYANWQSDSYGRKAVLLGNYAPDATKAMTKIYDVTARTWVASFEGTWNYWYPREGVYWTHFEAYDSYGDLADTRTYAFGVGLNPSLSGTAIINQGGGSYMFGGTTSNPVGSIRALVYDVSAGTWIWSASGTWSQWQAPHTGSYWVQIQSLYSDGSLADSKTFSFSYSVYPWWYDPSNPPLFTYGTLRQGAVAHHQLGGYNHIQSGKVVGEELWMFPSSAGRVSTWPWAVPGSSSARLVGDIVNYPASTASANLARVDRYEGAAAAHESARNYNRVLRQTEEGMSVWVYESTSWRQAYLRSSGYMVPSGDWFRR